MIGVTAGRYRGQGERGGRSDRRIARALAAQRASRSNPQTVIGPGNLISGNLRGVRISGSGPAPGVLVRDNLIGTDITGTLDLGNALEGVLIDNATDATIIQGNATGSQVISGNLVGVAIAGALRARETSSPAT